MKNCPANEEKYLASYLAGVMQGEKECLEAAQRLLGKYGSLSGVIQRGYGELETAVGASGAVGLKLLGWITSRRFTDEFKMGKVYTDEEIKSYLRWLYFCRDVECVYILFFDKGSRLISVNKLSEGTVNSSEIAPRRALEISARLKPKAASAIMAHNHPGGVISVSDSDAYATAVMKHALTSVGINLIDHLVVAGGDVGSVDV